MSGDLIDDKLYVDLMDELRQRVNVVDYVLAQRTGLPNVVAYELCLLQLRFVCEIIAAACLVAHGDVGGAGLRREWSAHTVMKALGELHKNFFPRATSFNVDAPDVRLAGDFHFQGDEIPGGMTKDELVDLYATCNDRLHRGSVRKIRASGGYAAPDWEEVNGWVRRIVELLQSHRIATLDERWHLFCLMAGENDRPKAWVTELIRAGEGKP